MNSNVRVLALALFAAMVSACAHVPRAPHSSDERDTMRAQYLEEHPQGRFNDVIQRGEIAKGMGALEVLASWGVPDERLKEKRRANEESWFYVERDEHSGDYVIYEIVFANTSLDAWYIMRGTAGSGGLFSSGASGYAAFREARLSSPATTPNNGAGGLKR